MTAILGISALYHDSAAALLVDGRIVAAAQEERFTRRKHDASAPVNAIEYCLREGGLEPEDLDLVGFYDKPFLKFERLLETYLAYTPRGFESFVKAMSAWLGEKQFVPKELGRALGGRYRKRYVFMEHHESHAASAFFPSPFEEAAILTLDGVGEWATGSFGAGRGNRIDLSHELRFPHSLGLLYSAFTYYTGFTVNSGEYKLMGLAPYGEPKYADRIVEKMMDLKQDGSFRLDMSYFNYCEGLTMTSRKFHDLFGAPPRAPETPIRALDMDVAASIQKVTEEIMLRSARHVHEQTGLSKLCLAGGVALNCVGNGRILREGPFDEIWIQPAAGDAGGALGAALFIWHQLLGNERIPSPGDTQRGSLLGVEYSDAEIGAFLEGVDASHSRLAGDAELCAHAAESIAAGKVVGWFQGRMEFGPRALGSRSILGDARRAEMQAGINLKVKFREGFRPFAPIVLREHTAEYFELEPRIESPYMLLVAPVQESKRLAPGRGEPELAGIDKLRRRRSLIPAVTHVDYSARIQTVDPERNPLLYQLMQVFHARTGCPVMVNTSFNLGWDPIVASPKDAFDTFMSSEIDTLYMGHFVLEKSEQRASAPPAVAREGRLIESDDRFASPCCGAALHGRNGKLECAACHHGFELADGIPQLFWPHEEIDDATDVTEMVKAFYEETPFPNYDDHDSVRSLIEKSRRGLYAQRLDQTIPYNADVLEVGCGTGQLSNFLGIGCRRVIGTDMCLNSLRLGEEFRSRHDLSRVLFVQMNLFRPCFRPTRFDVILCNGVLHHTADPYGGFRGLLPLLKPGGHIVIGLYNRYGRLLTDLRRQLFRLTGGRARWIDPVLRRGSISTGKRDAWFADQYRHPHESKHTMGEVLRWFDECGIEFVRGIPALTPDRDGLAGAHLFEPQPRGSALDRATVQLSEIVAAGQAEGGFFVMIGRRPGGRSREGAPPSGPYDAGARRSRAHV